MNRVERSGNAYRIYLHNPSPSVIAAVRRLPGRRVDPRDGAWVVPAIFGSAVAEFAATKLGLREAIEPSQGTPASLSYEGGWFKLAFDYSNSADVFTVACIPGSLWFQAEEVWLVPAAQGVRVQAWAQDRGVAVDGAARAAIREALLAVERAEASAAQDSDYNVPGLGIELYPYQRAGVRYVVEYADGRCIIGDEPGLGKTAQALAALHVLGAFPAIVVVPASLKVNWLREVRTILPGRSVEILRGTRPQLRLQWADVTIINYDILSAWQAVLPRPRGVVADESHLISNPRIQRTRATLKLFGRVPEEQGTAKLCLTGTAVNNRPSEVLSQVDAIGRLEQLGGAREAQRVYKHNGAALNKRLRASGYVRRVKRDVWDDMPERCWADVVVEGDPRVMVEYRRAERDIVSYLAARAESAARASGAATAEAVRAAWEASIRAEAARHLVAVSHLKRLAARAKMPAAREWVANFLESGSKLGVFAWHREVVDELAQEFGAVKIQGGQTESARQRAVDAFQGDDRVRVVCGQIRAAGLGLTLTAASNALVLEQAWTPGAMDQVLDRFHRRGQHGNVTGWLMLAEGTIDWDIRELVASKRRTVSETLDGYDRSGEETGGTVLQDLLVRLTARRLERS